MDDSNQPAPAKVNNVMPRWLVDKNREVIRIIEAIC